MQLLVAVVAGPGALSEGEEPWEHRAGGHRVGEDATEKGTVELGLQGCPKKGTESLEPKK